MADQLASKLSKLRQSARQKGHHVVDAAAAVLLEAPHALDARINLIGALHEVGALRNVLKPYWVEFRADEAAWARRCIERLVDHDHDAWALAALLGLPAETTVTQARALGFKALAVRRHERWDLPDAHVVSMAIHGVAASERVLTPLLELGFDSQSGELVDCVRARAVMLDHIEKIASGALTGTGTMHYFCRACLPHGAWRSVALPFDISAQALVTVADPVFALG